MLETIVRSSIAAMYPVDEIVHKTDHHCPYDDVYAYKEKMQADKEAFLQCTCDKKIYLHQAGIMMVYFFGGCANFEDQSEYTLGLLCETCYRSWTAVALLYKDQWLLLEDWLTSEVKTRNGWQMVKTYGERYAMYILNRMIYKFIEQSEGDCPYLSSTEDAKAKLLWKDGKAVGFYTFKEKGDAFLSKCQLGQMYHVINSVDTIFIRKAVRRQGYAMRLLENVITMWPKQVIGFQRPVSEDMFKVFKKFLYDHPEHRDYLYECWGTGEEQYRVNVWLYHIQGQKRKKLTQKVWNDNCSNEKKNKTDSSIDENVAVL